MERIIYDRMAVIQNKHWWFVARRQIIAGVLRGFGLSPQSRILEAGCGTGGNLEFLGQFGQVCAFEPDEQARRHALCGRDPARFDIRDGSLPDSIPFEASAFDLVAALDVLEHLDDDRRSLIALRRHLKPGGRGLFTVPALPILWSRHDILHHHLRRYRKAELATALNAAGFVDVQISYFNTWLFPVILAARITKNLLGERAGRDDQVPPEPINRMLAAIFASERHLIGRLPLPFGVSLQAIARKQNP